MKFLLHFDRFLYILFLFSHFLFLGREGRRGREKGETSIYLYGVNTLRVDGHEPKWFGRVPCLLSLGLSIIGIDCPVPYSPIKSQIKWKEGIYSTKRHMKKNQK
jgi:hypothetical protein